MSVATAPEPLRPREPDPDPVPVAVIGAGRVGLAMASLLATHTRARLAGIADGRRELRRFARDAGFHVPAEARPERLAQKAPFAAAIVCAPPDTRDVLALDALATGASVLALAPCDPGAAPGARLRVAAPLRFQPLVARAIELVHANAIGPLRRVHLSALAARVFGPAARPRRGDVLDHFGAAPLHLLEALLGPCRVTGCDLQSLYGGGADELHARFESHAASASLDASWSAPGYAAAAIVIEAEGETGRLLLADDALELDVAGAAGGAKRWTLADVGGGRFESGVPGLAPMLEAFLDEWNGEVSARFDPADARRVQGLVLALRAAAEPA